MTPSERRDFAASREYHICRDSFDGPDGPRWYWSSLARASVTRPRERGFIDLASGRWRWWDDATMLPFESGPWHELAGEIEPPTVDTAAASPVVELASEELHTSFTRECLAAGLTWESGQTVRLLDGRDLGNRYLHWQGRRYLAFSSTRRLILWEPGAPWVLLTLAELTAGAAAIATPVPRSPSPTPVPLTHAPMTYGLPVQMSGAGKQRRLF